MWVVPTDTVTSSGLMDIATTLRPHEPRVIGRNRDFALRIWDEISGDALARTGDAKRRDVGYFRAMRSLTRRIGREGAIDLVIAAALAAAGLAELWGASAFDDDPRGLVAVVILAMTLPLAVRRRWPLGVLVVVLVMATVSDR